ncbi:prostaglandin D2 synthase a isoform X2 [Ictalurus furcatus]|uniref:prostaglandin D2 synthase a isoform X2 n=1 Tax=Ictalurus furcatus TaxID=66913 RepID=UPI00234FC677|nr:prostaglandin D2 synthase a isoform X2 [Ictalurus furcatus]
MMKITLVSITVTIALLLEVHADVLPQKNFDLKRFAGRWYRVGLAYNSPGFARHRNKLTICMGVVEPKENGDVMMTVWKTKSSICQKEVYKYEKTAVPGVFTYFSTRRSQKLRPEVIEKFKKYATQHGFPEESIVIPPPADNCPLARH